MDNKEAGFKDEKAAKLMLTALVFFGITALLLGILNLGNILNEGNRLVAEDKQPTSVDSGAQADNLAKMMQTDTDGDGLSDYDEKYIYHTSIYLKDSDGDGYSDKEEIDNGYDPNCPKGENCHDINVQQTTGNSQPADNGETDSSTGTQSANGSEQQALTEQQKQELLNLSPDEIRQLLLKSGEISKEELDKIDDQTLKQVLEESLK